MQHLSSTQPRRFVHLINLLFEEVTVGGAAANLERYPGKDEKTNDLIPPILFAPFASGSPPSDGSLARSAFTG